ncbi:MAG TPA: hypothetical protein VEH31_33730 [Streptosporangiaceae bacterium]|nr:hypothetical protein [Streptosporangiaceae bacterium]
MPESRYRHGYAARRSIQAATGLLDWLGTRGLTMATSAAGANSASLSVPATRSGWNATAAPGT